jgi:hypothetical protein
MMNDSVREELEIKAAPNASSLNHIRKGVSAMQSKPNQPKMAAPPKPLFSARDTGELLKKPVAPPPAPSVESAPAAPTLVEFQNKNATLPDWRLKMQNAVRQRMENPAGEENAPKETQYQTRLVTSGANALKAEVIEEIAAEPLKNEKVANALKRIEQSRKAFFVEEAQPELIIADDSNQNKNYPFYIAARTTETEAKSPESKASVNVPPKPKLVTAAPRSADGEWTQINCRQLPSAAAIGFEKISSDVPGESPSRKTNQTIEPMMLTETAVKQHIVETAEVKNPMTSHLLRCASMPGFSI